MIPELLLTLIEILKLPNNGLREETLSLITNHMALSDSSVQRIICLQLLESTMEHNHFSRPFFRQLFSEVINMFRKETNKQVIQKLCSISVLLHKYLDFHFDESKKVIVSSSSRPVVYELLEQIKQFMLKDIKKL